MSLSPSLDGPARRSPRAPVTLVTLSVVRPSARRWRVAFLATSAVAATLAFAPFARADDGDGEGESVEKKVRAQMEKVLELMRSSEKQLLEASRVGGKKPDAPEVKPPDAPTRPSNPPPEGGSQGTPPPSPSSGGPAGGADSDGERARKALEEVLRSGAKVPHELEELVRMIPRKSSQSSSSDAPPDPDPQANSQSEPRRADQKPEDDPQSAEKSKGKKDEPKDGQPNPKDKPDSTPSGQGEKGDPATSDLPPWIVNLPEKAREYIVNGDPARAPPAYRDLIVRYHKWLAEHAKGTSR
jgi:hypothetical protein